MLDFSIIIAAYNEENRLPKTIYKILDYMKTRPENFEILIVNDGSKDKTVEKVEEIGRANPNVRVISHFPNWGRGASIKAGIFEAKGKILLETDADNSVANEAIGRFLDEFKTNHDVHVLIGSRETRGSLITLKQPFLRVFLGYGFIYFAKTLFWMWNIHDFTLGFKMFRREAALDIFKHQFDPHYVAEAEIIFASRARKWKLKELPVTWTDDRNSRIHPFRDSVRSFKGMFRVIGRSVMGKYTK